MTRGLMLGSPPGYCQSLWHRVEALSSWKAAILAGFICWGISIFLYAPPFWLPLAGGGETTSRVDDFIKLCANPLARDLNEPILAYRITTPMLAWILGLRGFSAVILQYVAIPATLCLVFYAMESRSDRRLAFLATLGVACSYTIIWTNTKPGFPDSVTHLAVAVLLVSRNRYLWLAMTVLGTLNDERFVLAIPFLLLWHAQSGSVATLWNSCLGRAVWIAFGLGIVGAIRYGLGAGLIGPGIEVPEVYHGITEVATLERGGPHEGWRSYLANVVMTYRGLWVVFALALLKPEHWSTRAIFLLSLALVIVSSGTVADVSRSIGFAFPAFLIAACDISKVPSLPRGSMLVLVLSCLITPCFHTSSAANSLGLDLQLERPLLLSLIRASTGWDIMEIF